MIAVATIVTRIRGRDVPIGFISHHGAPCAVVSCTDISAVTPDVFAEHCLANNIIGSSCNALMISHDDCICQN